MRTALVFGYYGKDNIGDDAMLQVITQWFKKIGVKTVAVSHNPGKTRKDFGIKAVGHNTDLSKIDYDFFVLGGGTQIQDYRLKGFENLVKYFLKAKKPGIKTCLLSIGSTKLKTAKGKALARKLCENSDLIIVRDNESREQLRKAGVKKQIYVSADLTFTESKKPDKRKRNAILFCPIPYYEIFELNPKKDRFLAKKIAKAIDLVAFETNARIEIFPFFKKYDTVFCKRILSSVNGKKARLLKYKPLGMKLAKTFEKFDLVVGMRFHSLVFSAVIGKPFVAIDFTAKTRNLVKAFGWQSFAVEQGFKAEELAEKTKRLYLEKAKAAKRLLAKRKKAEKKSKLAFKLFEEKLMKS